MEETKVIYYIDDEETPYLMKIGKPPELVTLGDFKGQLNRTYIKFFFKSEDDDFGVVKEELAEDDALLPQVNGRVVCWVVTESNVSGSEAGGSKGDSESVRGGKEADGMSIISGTSKASRRHHHKHRHSSSGRQHRSHRHRVGGGSTVSGTDLESATDFTTETETSCCDTEDATSRVSSSTLTSLRPRKKILTKHRPKLPRSISTSTITTTTMTDLSTTQIVKVTLNMDTVNFLGISIVGQTNEEGAGGIYVGSVMKGGAVAADGRIEPGDMLLEVNDISFENMSNDDAVRTLREIVQHPGPITLTVAKCWEPEPIVPNFEPRLEPIRPIDPSAWVMQTNQHQADYQAYRRQFAGSPTLSTMTSNSSPSLTSSIPESERDLVKLTLTTPMYRIAKALATPKSGLEVKDRIWLKMTIPKSFIGSDLVDWLHTNVDGFIDRRHARKYAALMLKHGFLRHTVNKITFSEQCYYVFGDFKAAANSLPSEFSHLALSNDSGDADTLGPLPGQHGGWGSSDGEFSVAYEYYQHKQPGQMSNSSKSSSPSPGDKQQMYASRSSGSSSASGTSNSQQSRQQRPSSGNSNSNNRGNMAVHPYNPNIRRSPSISSSSEFTSVSQQQMPPPPPYQHPQGVGVFVEPDRVSVRSDHIGNLGVTAHLANSRESFQQALDNPCEYFIDVM
ncbi:segment polarity protein dishevelled homolog DVL-3-like isoform X2 [Halichondria panicea]|uniref:segment polarity protein dishevelled homolog DVL-3-like isoform X2 n=1 Tax=Halichondria panicea TaxID=6063 RepID=UPI00312B5DAF